VRNVTTISLAAAPQQQQPPTTEEIPTTTPTTMRKNTTTTSSKADEEQQLFALPEEPPMPSLADTTTEDGDDAGVDDYDADEVEPTFSSDQQEDMGQEALWVEEDNSTTTAATTPSKQRSKFFGGGKKSSSTPRKQQPPSSLSNKHKRHVLLLGADDEEDVENTNTNTNNTATRSSPASTTTTASTATASSPERQAARKILTARQMLEQASSLQQHQQSKASSSSTSPELLARAAFGQACEARLLMSNNANTSSGIVTPEMDQVLQDAVTKGVAAVRNKETERAKQLLEWILPASVDEAVLEQVARAWSSSSGSDEATSSSSNVIPNNLTLDTSTSSLGFDTKGSSSFDCTSPRRNNDADDVLSMSSLNEILDGPISPIHQVPQEIDTIKKKGKKQSKHKKQQSAATPVEQPSVIHEGEEEEEEEVQSLHSVASRKKSKKSTTKATAAVAAGTVAVVAVASVEKKGGLFRRFKSSKKNGSIRGGDIQRFTPTVLMEDGVGGSGGDDEETPPQLGDIKTDDSRIAQVDARISQLLEKAAADDNTCSITSMDGVPVYTHDKSKHAEQMERKILKALSQDDDDKKATAAFPHNMFVAPTFMTAPMRDPASIMGHASLDSMQAAGMIDEEDGIPPPPLVVEKALPAEEEEEFNLEDLQHPSSPSSTVLLESASTDKYTVIAEGDDVVEDKYSILPDPCSFCDSLWSNMSSPVAIAAAAEAEEEEEAMLSEKALKEAAEAAAAVVDKDGDDADNGPDKYATEQDDAADDKFAEATDSAVIEDVPDNKTTATKRRGVGGLFGKFKRSSKNVVDNELVAAASEVTKATPTRSLRGFGKSKKSILKEKSKTSLNMGEQPEEVSSMFKISVTSYEDSQKQQLQSEPEQQPTQDADAATEGSSGSEHEDVAQQQQVSLVEHIKSSSSSSQRGRMDPASAEELQSRPVPVDP